MTQDVYIVEAFGKVEKVFTTKKLAHAYVTAMLEKHPDDCDDDTFEVIEMVLQNYLSTTDVEITTKRG